MTLESQQHRPQRPQTRIGLGMQDYELSDPALTEDDELELDKDDMYEVWLDEVFYAEYPFT